MSERHPVVIGVGNTFRGDDAVGLAVVARLRERTPDGVTVVPCEQEPSRLMEAWEEASAVLVVDAVTSGAEPGTLHRFDASDEAIPTQVFRSSTHAFGVGEAIELARALGKLPARVIVYGVEGGEFSSGEGMTAPVAAAVDGVVAAVLDDLDGLER